MVARDGSEKEFGIRGSACDAILVALPWLVLWLATAPAWSWGWALADELNVLLLAKAYLPWDYFFDPQVYHLLSPNNLTPWTILSHAGDLWLASLLDAGVSLPRIVRIHEMAAAALLVNTVYLLGRLRLSRLLAGAGVLVLCFTWPLIDSALSLPSRHYVEGSILALLSLYFYARGRGMAGSALRGGFVLSTFFYLLSVTAKEVFVPLPLFLFLVERGDLGRRVRNLSGHFAVVLLYLAWRHFMLGNLVGGYADGGEDLAVFADASRALALLGLLPGSLFRGTLSGPLFLLAWSVAFLYAAKQGRWSLASVVAFVLCLGVPLLPVVVMVEAFGPGLTARYFLVIAWAIVLVWGLSLATVRHRGWLAAALIVSIAAIVLSLPATRDALDERHAFLRHRAVDCGDLILRRGPDTAILLGPTPFSNAYANFMARAKEAFEIGEAPHVLEDPWLLPEGFENMAVFEMRPRVASCYVTSPGLRAQWLRERAAMRVDPAWNPRLAWEPDGLRLEEEDPHPMGTSVLVRGVQGGLRLDIPPGRNRVSGLQKALFSHGVEAPARLSLAHPGADGSVRVSLPLDLPQRYWAFQDR